MPSIGSRIKAAWDAFRDDYKGYRDYGIGTGHRPDRPRLVKGGERSIVASIYNRIAIDCAAIRIEHVRLREKDGSYEDTLDTYLNECLTISPNLDQSPSAFKRDIVMSMFDKGCVAVVPVETSANPETTSGYDIYQLRVGEIIQWYPQHVKVRLYNEKTGLKEEITCAKKDTAIIENPLYSIINEPNSTAQRLIRKLALLDISDEKVNSGKLDLIIGLPYVIKSEARRKQAEERMNQIEKQLENGRYGIAYTDGTEHITQLNRPVENNLMESIKYFTSMLYSQLGITEEIMNGTADEKAMLNYYSRTIEPIMEAITEELTRKFLSRTARSQRQAIRSYRDLFKLASTSEIAEMGDKLTRNEIMSSNELRSRLGLKPSDDPNADALKNKNIADPNAALMNPGVQMEPGAESEEVPEEMAPEQNSPVSMLSPSGKNALAEVLGQKMSEYQEVIQNE